MIQNYCNRYCIAFITTILFAFTTALSAQPSSQATNLQASHRDGQTFLTWDEISGTDVIY